MGNDHIIINIVSALTLGLRVALYGTIGYYSTAGGFDHEERRILFYLLGPISVIYLASFVRFTIRYAYTTAQVQLRRFIFGFNLIFILSVHLIAIALIVYNAYYKLGLPFEVLLPILYGIEILNSIYIATMLAKLFEIRE